MPRDELESLARAMDHSLRVAQTFYRHEQHKLIAEPSHKIKHLLQINQLQEEEQRQSGHYKNTGQKERGHSLIVSVVSALQAVIEQRQGLYIAKPFTPETVRLAYMTARANATGRYYIIPEAP